MYFAEFIKSLNKQADLTPTQIAELLWYWEKIPCEPISDPTSPEDENKDLSLPSPTPTPKPIPDNVGDRELLREPSYQTSKVDLYPKEIDKYLTKPSKHKLTPLQIPDAPAIPNKRQIQRSLRRLRKRFPSQKNKQLDESATANNIANSKIWSPIFKPTYTYRWLSLVLVVEITNSLVIWKQTITELRLILKRLGVFYHIEVWGLQVNINKPSEKEGIQLYRYDDNQMQSYPPEAIANGQKNPIILLASDMVSQAWSRPAIYTLLEQWSQKGIVNILQLLPKRLWSRSVLGQQQYLKLNSLPLSPNKICNFPVVSLESETLDNWINLLKGIVNNQADGYLLIYPELPPIDTAPLPHPQQRVKDFQIISSATALRLAEYLSTTLVTLPVIRVIQYTMLPPSNPSHVAEVLMGGLFKPLDETITPHIDPDEIEFYFHEGIREELLTCLTIDEITLVMETVSAYIAQKMGKTQREFEALLVSSQAHYQQDSLAQQIYPLAQIQAEILSKLGGQYTQYAEAIYEAQEFQEIRWANDSLQPLSVDIPTLTFPETEELPKLQFTTVFVNSRGERIREEEGEAYYYDEALGEESLRMIYIPAREFLMGTEGKERERLKNKGHSWVDREMPSHLVKVPAFYLSQTPITQGQWKEVAIKIERVIIRLEPELAYYKKDPPNTRLKKGEKAKTRWDDRPVEQVSWEEAVEFCQRLTKLTGRAYQLPSEAQWEYACRAGTITPFHFGETLTLDLANYNGNRTFADESKGKYRGETTPVGQFPPNGFGLYDMHGNVWEWCKDDYHPNYEGNPPLDGSAWSEGDSGTKILRGGSWDNNPEYCRSAIRSNYYRDVRGSYYGFRVMCWSGRT